MGFIQNINYSLRLYNLKPTLYYEFNPRFYNPELVFLFRIEPIRYANQFQILKSISHSLVHFTFRIVPIRYSNSTFHIEPPNPIRKSFSISNSTNLVIIYM